jgi:hypothetical protein
MVALVCASHRTEKNEKTNNRRKIGGADVMVLARMSRTLLFWALRAVAGKTIERHPQGRTTPRAVARLNL